MASELHFNRAYLSAQAAAEHLLIVAVKRSMGGDGLKDTQKAIAALSNCAQVMGFDLVPRPDETRAVHDAAVMKSPDELVWCDPAECGWGCNDPLCPYIHKDTWHVEGLQTPFYTRDAAIEAAVKELEANGHTRIA